MVTKTRLKFDILTIFPDMFQGVFKESLIGKATSKGIITIDIVNTRSFTRDKHHTVDDRPFGGGAGMVMKVEPLYRAIQKYRAGKNKREREILLLSPQGRLFDQAQAKELARKKHLVLLCGHYEGFDERIRSFVDREVSIGDYVLTGGEIPAMVVVDAVTRMLPGVVKEKESVRNDSFFHGKLDYPQYTRPAEFKGLRVPGVLLSGHHAAIAQWRKKMGLKNTLKKRPDLLQRHKPNREEKILLQELIKENKK